MIKQIFVLGLSFSGGNVTSRGVFALFDHLCLALGTVPMGYFLDSKFKSTSTESLIDFLTYREQKFWLINQKLTKILLPQKPLRGTFLPRQ